MLKKSMFNLQSIISMLFNNKFCLHECTLFVVDALKASGKLSKSEHGSIYFINLRTIVSESCNFLEPSAESCTTAVPYLYKILAHNIQRHFAYKLSLLFYWPQAGSVDIYYSVYIYICKTPIPKSLVLSL